MERYVDILLERMEIFKKWKEYVPKICSAVKLILPDARIYVFGSIVRGESVGGSDIDILIVSQNIPVSNLERAKIRSQIEQAVNLPLHHPFEFHIVNLNEAEWYFERVRELEEVNG